MMSMVKMRLSIHLKSEWPIYLGRKPGSSRHRVRWQTNSAFDCLLILARNFSLKRMRTLCELNWELALHMAASQLERGLHPAAHSKRKPHLQWLDLTLGRIWFLQKLLRLKIHTTLVVEQFNKSLKSRDSMRAPANQVLRSILMVHEFGMHILPVVLRLASMANISKPSASVYLKD